MKSPSPRVSVVICVVDPHPTYFLEAVRSILGQTLSDLELIIIEEPVPEGASAGTLLESIDDPRVRHCLHPRRTSLVEQRNRGLALARSDLVALLDADDVSWPERLERQAVYLEAHPEIGVLGSQLELIDPDGCPIGYRRYPITPAAVGAALRRFNPVGQPAVMYRASVVLAAGGYRPARYPVAEDFDLWCTLHQAGVAIANLDRPLVSYRLHPGGIKMTKLHDTIRGSIEIKQRYFGHRLGLRGRTRLWGERLLLLLPASWVMWLFLRVSVRSRQ